MGNGYLDGFNWARPKSVLKLELGFEFGLKLWVGYEGKVYQKPTY